MYCSIDLDVQAFKEITDRVKLIEKISFISTTCFYCGKKSTLPELRYSPVTTSQTHTLPRISKRGYTQKAAVCHA